MSHMSTDTSVASPSTMRQTPLSPTSRIATLMRRMSTLISCAYVSAELAREALFRRPTSWRPFTSSWRLKAWQRTPMDKPIPISSIAGIQVFICSPEESIAGLIRPHGQETKSSNQTPARWRALARPRGRPVVAAHHSRCLRRHEALRRIPAEPARGEEHPRGPAEEPGAGRRARTRARIRRHDVPGIRSHAQGQRSFPVVVPPGEQHLYGKGEAHSVLDERVSVKCRCASSTCARTTASRFSMRPTRS